MTEITRVPLRPVAKGSLAKLWIGVIAAIGLAILLAWSLAPKGYGLTTIEEGSGPNPTETDVMFVNYVGKLKDGTVFDQSQPRQPLPPEIEALVPNGDPLPLGNMIAGFTEGAVQMQKGGKYELRIPAAKGYGAEERTNPQTGEVVIPANSDLVFEIEVIDFMSQAEFERRVQMITQMMEQPGAMPGNPAEGEPIPPPQ